MKNIIKDVVTSDSIVGYVEIKRPDLGTESVLSAYFPITPTEGLTYSYILSGNGAVELISPSAYDAEPVAQNREGFDALAGTLPLFRKKMEITEEEKNRLALYINGNNDSGTIALLKKIYNDQLTLFNGAMMTVEFLRSRALMDGKIVMASKGGAVAVDYLIPADNKYVLTGSDKWTDPDAPIVDQIKSALDKVEDNTGERPTKMLLNRKTFSYVLNNNQIKNYMIPLSLIASATVKDNVVIADEQIKQSFKALTGISEVIVYNKVVKLDKKKIDIIEDNKVSFFPDGILGEALMGTSPAELASSYITNSDADITVSGEGIATNVIAKSSAPYTIETQVEFVGLPSFPTALEVVIMTVA